jgi:hypothetical protein
MAETIYHVILIAAMLGFFALLFVVAIVWIIEDWQ